MKKIIQIIVSIILLIILFNWIDFDEVKKSFANPKYEYFAVAFLVIIFDRVLMAFKWRLLLKTKNINISLLEAIKIYYIGNFFGLFLPTTIGTDIVRTYYTTKKGAFKTDVISVIIMERLLGFLCLFIAGLIGLVLIIDMTSKSNFESDQFFTAMILFAVIFFTGFLLSLNRSVNNSLLRFLSSKKEKKYWKKFVPVTVDLINSYSSHKKFKLVLINFSLLTFLEIFLIILLNYITALGLNVNIPLVYFTAFLPLVLLLERLPVSFDGLGITEGMSVYFLSLINIPSSIGFSVGFIAHLINMVGKLPGGLFYALNGNLNELKESRDAIIRKTVDGIILSWNIGAEFVYGYSTQEVIGKHIPIIIPEDRIQEREEYQKKLLQGEKIKLETERIRKDGVRIQISLSLFPIKDSKGKIIEAVTNEREINKKQINTEFLSVCI